MSAGFAIPDVLRRKVWRAFGEQGTAWLADLPRLYAECVAKWRLEAPYPSPVMSFNYLAFARSPAYGEVALKIGCPNPELDTETQALAAYDGDGACRLLDSDPGLGALLLERLRPGYDLTTVGTTAERAAIAMTLAATLPRAFVAPAGQGHSLPRVVDWAARAFGRARREGIVGPRMLVMIDAAEGLLPVIEAPDRPLVLLHGDLNHWNILSSGHCWRAIDPKGSIGVRPFEAGRFILNELALTPRSSWLAGLATMTAAARAAMGEPAHLIVACAFFDGVLSTCWSFEEHGRRDLTPNIERCEYLLAAYRRLAG